VISLKRLAKLKQKKYRERERRFLAEGALLVREAPYPPEHLFEDEASVRRLSSLTTPSGPVAVFPFLDLSQEELLRCRDRLALLHGVQDPGNVGTVIRSAHAFGAGVALSRGCADLYNPKTVRATMGSIFRVPLAREVEPPEFLRRAREAGFAPVAAVAAGGASPGSLPAGRLVIVVGSEGSGLPEEVVSACETSVTIPAEAHSLNAAVAASILLYAAYSRVLT
jgi:TrmH family RNA methyltransferase